MKHLIIICEGLTEINFCKTILAPLLLNANIYCQPVKIKKSGGGIVCWDALKQQIKTHLRGKNGQSFVTTLIDLYGLCEDYYQDIEFNVELIEQRMYDQINNVRFIPYIQKHEFEALIFCSSAPFRQIFECDDAIADIEKIIQQFPNPEDINQGAKTAPSKRIKKLIPKYEKPLDGIRLVELTGIDPIRKKCPRFNNWIEKLTQLH